MAKKAKTVLKLPPIASRKPKGLISVVNNTFASAVLPIIRPGMHVWAEWLAVLGVQSEKELKCVYCGTAANLQLDHLNATIIENQPSGFFAECANLVPACSTCNNGRGNTPWEDWLRSKCAENGDSAQIMEQRATVMRRFLLRYTAVRLECRNSGDENHWAEYDQIRHEINRLLARAQEISDQLRAAVTGDFQQRPKIR